MDATTYDQQIIDIHTAECISSMQDTLAMLKRMVADVEDEVAAAAKDREVFGHAIKIQDAVLWAAWNCKLSALSNSAARVSYCQGLKEGRSSCEPEPTS
jgi:hypothetical protein